MVTRLSDVVVPEIFNPYVAQQTAVKSNLIASGAVALDARLSQKLAEGGLTFNEPSYRDLADDDENIGSDDPSEDSTPKKIGTSTEIQVRMSRNQSWSNMELVTALSGSDPMEAIGNRVAEYRTRRLQAAFVATMKGVFANNALATPGGTASQDDLTYSISENAATPGNFEDGVTNFNANAVIDTTATMGDSMEDLSLIMVHSVIYARMQKQNLITFIPDSLGVVRIPTYLNRVVVVDDAMPATSGVFESWFFSNGSVLWGQGDPETPTEVDRSASAGNGSGQETLHNRWEWIIHPAGHAYVGTPANGGPSNLATAGNLAHSASFNRVFPERKQIKIARLITREF